MLVKQQMAGKSDCCKCGWFRKGTYREQGERCEGLGSGKLVAQQHVGCECSNRHEGRNGIQQKAVEGGNSEGLPKNVQLGLPHFLDSVPEGILQHGRAVKTKFA